MTKIYALRKKFIIAMKRARIKANKASLLFTIIARFRFAFFALFKLLSSSSSGVMVGKNAVDEDADEGRQLSKIS